MFGTGGEIFNNVVNDDESNSLTNNNSFKVKVIAMHVSPSDANFLMSTIHDFYLSGADFIDSNTKYLIHKGKEVGLAIGDFPTIKIIEIEANSKVESWKSQKHEVGQILAVLKIE